VTDARALAEALCSRHASPRDASELDAVAGALQAAIADARAQWPDVAPDLREYVAYVGDRLDPEQPPAVALAELELGDLWLAYACSLGGTAAIAAFERAFAGELDHAFARLKTRTLDAADLRQRLITRLFIADGEQPPRIVGYSGVGRLRAWVRVAATRLRIDAERVLSDRQDVEPPDPRGGVPTPFDDPELEYLRRHYREEFIAALGAAFAALAPRQRLLLRQNLVQGISSTDLAGLFGVHRATAKRWLADAREALLAGTKRELAQRVGRSIDELDSILRLIESRLDLSLRMVLHETGAEPR
jgi:RNA polymerase sigma-70 factor (ECF subfamily)